MGVQMKWLWLHFLLLSPLVAPVPALANPVESAQEYRGRRIVDVDFT